jgi:GTP cyclohydrolase IA
MPGNAFPPHPHTNPLLKAMTVEEEEQREKAAADLKAKAEEIHTRLQKMQALIIDPRADQWKQDSLRREAIEAATVALRIAAGLNESFHSEDTPRRFVDMLMELTTPTEIKWTTFPNENMDEMIIQRSIPFSSLCEHHVIPFIGVCHIGYVPKDLIVGLSKLARVVHHFAHALQVQERLTQQIADFLNENLKPRGVAVIMDAEHLCMTVRGAQAPGTRTSTATMLGVFGDHDRTAKMEFLSRLGG